MEAVPGETEVQAPAQIAVRPIPSLLVREIWHEPELQDLVARGLHESGDLETAEDLLDALEEARCQLWAVFRDCFVAAIAVTKIVAHPRKMVAEIILLAGDGIEGWAGDLLRQIETWARGEGCAWLEPHARRGFVQLAKRHGFRPVAQIFRKELI